MSSSNEAQGSPVVEAIKWLLVFILLGASIAAANYSSGLFPNQWAQWGAVAVLGLAAAGIALLTGKGKAFIGAFMASRTEMRKVVWPTNKETNQSTLIVLVVVVIMGIFLYLADMLLGWVISSIIG
jgi:preprotein translocase subunit SecE